MPVAGNDGKSRWQCPICNEQLGSDHDFTVHIRSHNTTQAKQPNTCTICGKVLSSQSSLDRHMLVHSGQFTSCGPLVHSGHSHPAFCWCILVSSFPVLCWCIPFWSVHFLYFTACLVHSGQFTSCILLLIFSLSVFRCLFDAFQSIHLLYFADAFQSGHFLYSAGAFQSVHLLHSAAGLVHSSQFISCIPLPVWCIPVSSLLVFCCPFGAFRSVHFLYFAAHLVHSGQFTSCIWMLVKLMAASSVRVEEGGLHSSGTEKVFGPFCCFCYHLFFCLPYSTWAFNLIAFNQLLSTVHSLAEHCLLDLTPFVAQ